MSFCLEIYDADPTTRIKLIRARVKRSGLRTLARKLGVRETVLASDLGIRLSGSELVPQAPSERVIGLMSLIGRLESMIARSGATDFDAAKWLGAWLEAPLPALGGERPGSYLDTMAGQELLGRLIAMFESGAFA